MSNSEATTWVLALALREWADDQDEVAECYEQQSPDRADDAAEMRSQAAIARAEADRLDAVGSPYYQDDLVTLYHGDCREITEWLTADVLVTDPPYGMAYSGFGGRPGMNDASTHAPIAGDTSPEMRDHVLGLWGTERPALVFGTWRVQRPAGTRQVIVWDKSDNGPGMGALDLPWGPSHEEIYVLGSGFVGKRAGSVYRCTPYTSQDKSRPEHPTPKPPDLMERLIIRTEGVVADPFAGSGSTLVAAKRLGIKSIGIEMDERYCEIAAKRLAQGVLDFAASP